MEREVFVFTETHGQGYRADEVDNIYRVFNTNAE